MCVSLLALVCPACAESCRPLREPRALNPSFTMHVSLDITVLIVMLALLAVRRLVAQRPAPTTNNDAQRSERLLVKAPGRALAAHMS